jgi:hypothetical protein
MLPLVSPPEFFDPELWLDIMLKVNLEALLKVVCRKSRIIVKIFHAGSIRVCIFLGIWGIVWHVSACLAIVYRQQKMSRRHEGIHIVESESVQ